MLENQQAGNNQSKNVNNNTTEQSCVGTTNTESTDQGTWGSSSAGKTGSQPETPKQNSSMNPALSRALIGGLIGGTLGSLAGALAGKRIGEGFNHTIKGVGEATKTIGEGLGHTVRGMGEVAKSVAEGASYAVIGDGLDAVEGVKQGAVGTINALQKTSRDVNAAVQETAERTKEAAENSLASENGGRQDRQQTQNQDVGMGQRETTHSIYISSPENTAGYIGEPTAFVNEEISVEIFEDGSLQEEINRIDS
ncbi:hypothetical protein [Nodularia chucula]|uniref:hypothetical protein n=1 Tax=Nodularia chucula TaxID=3093667 RepID=UPI0039C5F437